LIITLANCQYEQPILESCENGTRPVYVFNSAYTILPDGTTLCCPLYQSDSNCTSEEEVQSTCPNGIVPEALSSLCKGNHAEKAVEVYIAFKEFVRGSNIGMYCRDLYPDAGVCVTLHKY